MSEIIDFNQWFSVYNIKNMKIYKKVVNRYQIKILKIIINFNVIMVNSPIKQLTNQASCTKS